MALKPKKESERHGDRIKAKRKELGLTQTFIANFIGVTPPTIGQWERSETSPKGENIVKLAEIFQVSPEWIISGKSTITHTGNNTIKTEGVRLIPLISLNDMSQNDTVAKRIASSVDFRLCSGIESVDAFAMVTTGDAMLNPYGAPSMPDGTILIVDPGVKHSDKSFVVVASKKNGQLFRQFVHDGPYRWLRALNPEFTKLELQKQDVVLGTVVKIEMDLPSRS